MAIETDENGKAKLKSVIEFFKLDGDKTMALGKEFAELDDESKDQIKTGLGNGSLTY